MKKARFYKLFALLSMAALLLSACHGQIAGLCWQSYGDKE